MAKEIKANCTPVIMARWPDGPMARCWPALTCTGPALTKHMSFIIRTCSPWENGYIESFNGRLSDELLHREIFATLLEAKVLMEKWRQGYNASGRTVP